LPIRSATKTCGGAVALICSGKRTAQQKKGQVALKKVTCPNFLKGTDVGVFAVGQSIPLP